MRSLNRSVLGLAVVATTALKLPAVAGAQSVTVGAPAYNGNNIGLVAQPNGQMQAWGQTFRTPDATLIHLDSWSFWLDAYSQATNPTVSFQMDIIEWNNGFVGSALYSSAVNTPTDPDREQFTFNVGQDLDPTKMYMAFLHPTGISGPNPNNTYGLSGVWYACNILDPGGLPRAVPCGQPDSYTQGDMVSVDSRFNSTNGAYDDIMNNPVVFDYGGSYDLNFEASFSEPVTATPEPATMSLMATGMVGMAGFVRRRRRSAS